MNSFIKVLKVKDLKKKIFFTIGIIFLFRLGSLIPTPGIDIGIIKELIKNNGFFSLYDLFSGKAMSQFAIFSLGISPYITASIILQLLSVGFERLKELYEGGEVGRKKQKLHTKLLGALFAIIQSTALTFSFIVPNKILLSDNTWFSIVPIASLTIGAILVMYLADLVDKKGIGNGVSLMIFVSIIASLPENIMLLFNGFKSKTITTYVFVGILLGGFLLLMLTIYVQESVRKVSVQYAKKVSGSQFLANNTSHIPLKLNQGGVMPVIFASTILSIPQIFTMLNNEAITKFINTWLSPNGAKGLIVYVLLQGFLIVAFTYFTLITMFNIEEMAENIRKQGGFIPGIRPGKSTVEYLTKIVNRLNFVGAIFLVFVASLPLIVGFFANISLLLGGTSLLIVVSVALELYRKIQTELSMKTYKGFLG